nr:DNA primase large subunit-like [Biomphalaria glabrata]
MYGLKRLQFLIRLVQCRNDKEVEDVIQDTSIVDNSDCLIIGTAKDLISHYILRLLLGGCSETATFFCESESAFFKLQLKQMDKEELRIFFRGLDKNLKVFNVSSFYRMPLSNLLYLVEALKEIFPSWSTLVEEMCDDRSQTSVCLPFQMVLHLVASREVELQKGSAFVPLKLLKEVLQEQHQAVMSAFVQQARHAREAAIKDERIKRLAAVFKQVYRSEFKSSVDIQQNSTPLRLPELSSKEILFPPCMGNLMKALRHRHRLKHQDRIQLTLFLKELGLPLHDALLLWKHEYSKPDTSGDHKGWQGSEKKYIYNIQHLYGLQGGMINYRAHSCPSIQEISGFIGQIMPISTLATCRQAVLFSNRGDYFLVVIMVDVLLLSKIKQFCPAWLKM